MRALQGKYGFALLFGGIFLLLSVLVVQFELDPSLNPNPSLTFLAGRDANLRYVSLGMMLFCAVGAIGVLCWGLVRRWAWAHRPTFQLLVVFFLVLTVFLSAIFYFYARRGIVEDQFVHRYDTFHYFMAPRYYDELNYEDLYVCTLKALKKADISSGTLVRDLRTYRMTTAKQLRKQKLCPKGNFSPERWQRFKSDLAVYTQTRGGYSLIRRAIADRGYNGTPVHAAISGYVADKIPFTVASHNLLPLFDAFLICAMLYGVATVFGWKVGLLFALSVFAMAADRWGIIGASWLRYTWYFTLVMGLVALRKGRYGWSGFWMTFSVLLNVFPAVFMVGVGVRGLLTCLKERRLVARYKRFAVASVLTLAVGLCIGASPTRHLENYTGWLDNMQNHNVERFQGFGTGLKFPFIYRGFHTEKEDKVRERERSKLFANNRNAYYPLAALLLFLAVAFACKTDDDVEASSILGFTIFFCLLGTVGYYFACASVVILGLYRRAYSPGGTLLLSLWFTVSFLANWALYETNYYRFMYNTVLSTGWTVWLLALLFWLAAREGILNGIGRRLAAPAKSLT